MAELTKLNFIQYLCEKHLTKLGLQQDQRYILQLEKELSNIEVQNNIDYVLNILKTETKIEKHGSLIYYLLGISQTDPVQSNLPLVIKKQSSFPDIDSDFSINEREQVIKYFINKYGSDHVAPIGSYGQMKMKMVTRDIARIFDIDLNDTNDVVKNLGDDVDLLSEEDFDILIAKEPGDKEFRKDLYDLRKYFDRHPQIKDIIFKLKGQLRHLTKHPAGVVATPDKIDESIPLMRHKDELITSWVDGIIRKDLQSSGFIKFDILGLKTLTIVKEILDLIRLRKSYNKEADFDIESIDNGQLTSLLYEEFSAKLPLDGNDLVYERFRQTDTNGIFQFECIGENSWIGNYRIEELYNKFVQDPESVNKIGCVDLKNKRKIRQKIQAMQKKQDHVFILILENQMCIESTQLHEYYAKKNRKIDWYQLKDLKVGDNVLIDQERERSQYYCESSRAIVEQCRVDNICKQCIKKNCEPKVLGKFKKYTQRYKFIKIKKFIYSGLKTVYDIGFNTKQKHNYVANGFVVHNSSLMKSLLKEIKPNSFADITSATALGRPGPLDMGMHHEYAERKHGKKFDFGSALIEKCLKESYGILVYQEDVMRLCHIVAGFPLDLTDTVRKNLMKSVRDTDAKDKSAKQRAEIKDKFIKGCVSNGLTSKVAESWWDNCVSFTRYGFNKSHAVAYTILSYQMMWFKMYYPLEFFVVLFSNSLTEKFPSYFAEAMNKGINIIPVDIRTANRGFTIHENNIMFGIEHIVGVGPAAVNTIVTSQPFVSFEGFYSKTAEIKKIGKGVVVALIDAHAFDCFGTQNEILQKYFVEIRKEKNWQQDVDYNDKKFEHDRFVEAYGVDWRTKLTDIQKQKIKDIGAKSLTKFTEPRLHQKQYSWGIITDIIKKTSKNGNAYYYVVLTDAKFNIVKVRLPIYNKRCQKALIPVGDKFKKIPILDVIKIANIIAGEVETSQYMDHIFIDMYDVCCVGNVYEKTEEQKERMAKYEAIAKEVEA